MQRFKTIYFIYNADGGLLNEVKYWVNKNIFKRPTACELCGISHGKIFVKSEWLKFLNDLQRDYKVEVLHRNEIPRKIEEKRFSYPCVVGETEDDLIELISSISFKTFQKNEGIHELSEKLSMKM